MGQDKSQPFNVLNAINVNGHTEKKEGLTYLTWSWAWEAVKRAYPEASYTIWKDDRGLPYVYDPLTGYMVYTAVTIEGITHEMWLPVMDSKNKAMKAEPYKYKTKYGEKTVEPATMFDINKTIMRCLVKNLAMFGLGLYIYAGEDLPADEKNSKAQDKPKTKEPTEQDARMTEAQARTRVLAYVNKCGMDAEAIKKLCALYKVASLQDMNYQQCQHYINYISSKGGQI